MLLTREDIRLKGSKIVNVCPDPFCCNPAHLYVVTNRNHYLDNVRASIADEEWETIRGHILRLEALRISELQTKIETVHKNSSRPIDKLLALEEANLKLRFAALSNDEILMQATIAGARNVHQSPDLISFDDFLQQYQLKTAYSFLGEGSKALLEQMADFRLTRCSPVQKYILSLIWLAKITKNADLFTELKSKSLVQGELEDVRL
jgi:hypothetical protein